jgi:hypothetical protein
LTNKVQITDTTLVFKIGQGVSKGALLHLHYYYGQPIESLLQKARKAENFCIWSEFPLRTEYDLERTEVIFSVLNSNAIGNDTNIFSKKYEGNEDNWKTQTMILGVRMRWQNLRPEFRACPSVTG